MPEIPRAVIFDFGNVLTLPPRPRDKARMQRVAGLEEVRFASRYRRHRREYDRGCLDGRGYWSRVLDSRAPADLEKRVEALVRMDFQSWTRINRPVLKWAFALRGAGVPIAILSNMPCDLLAMIRRRFGWLSRFDATVFSCEVGSVKPEAAIYHGCLEALRVKAEQALFLDDTQENVAGALQAGLPALLFRSLKEVREQVRGRFILPGG